MERFEHAIDALRLRKIYHEDQILQERYKSVFSEIQEEIDDIDDAIRKLRNHSLTDRM